MEIDELVERVARKIGIEMLERQGGELDPEQREWRGFYGGNWIPFRLMPLAQAAIAAMPEITALRAELAEVRSRLDAVLASSGARGRFHSLEYSDAVDAAETILARTLAPQPPPAAATLEREG